MSKIVKQLSAILLSAAMVVTLIPVLGINTAHAAAHSEYELHFHDILSYSCNYIEADTVRFGNNGEYSWRVIGYDGNGAVSSNGTMTLLAADTMGETQFKESMSMGHDYSDSLLRARVDEIAGNFSDSEKSAIIKRTLVSGPYSNDETDCISGDPVENAVLWPLSQKEAKQVNGKILLGPNEKPWWLRSQGHDPLYGVIVKKYGTVGDVCAVTVDNTYGVRPAFQLDLDSVIMVSTAAGGKDFGAGGLAANRYVLGSECKLTVKDDKHKDFKVDSYKLDSNNNLTFEYSGAVTGTNEYISVLIECNNRINYYGRIKPADAAKGVATVDISGKYNDGDTIYIFNEQANGDNCTDYASNLYKVDPRIAVFAGELSGSGTKNDPWQIDNARHWNLLADAVENGVDISDKCFSLTGDISTDTMIGTQENPFCGTLDGAGKKLTVSLNGSEDFIAPFRYAKNASFSNLRVDGTISITGGTASGLVGKALGDCSVTNCVSDIDITGSGGGGHAGFVANCKDVTVSVRGSAFTGSISDARATYCAGFLGWAGSAVDDCVYDGAMATGGNSNDFIRTSDYAKNCYYTNCDGIDRIKGKQAHSVKAAEGIDIDFGSGTSYDVSKITAFEHGLKYNGVFYAAKEEKIALTMPDVSAQGKKYVASAGALTGSGTSYTLVMPDEDVVISTETIPGAEGDKVSIKDAEVVLSKASFTYNAKVQKPSVKTIKGLVLKEGTDYTADWSNKSSKNAGTYTVTITGKGGYTGTTKASYKISPKAIKPAVALAASSCKWTGKAKKPAVKVKDGSTKLAASDYTVAYKNNRNVGKASVVVKMKGNYSGSRTVTFKINPKGTSLRNPAKASGSVTVKWKKQATKMSSSRITGYQIKLATNSKFTKNKKTVTVNGYKKTSGKVAGLKSGNKYYIKIRTYKKVGGKKYYSPWSKYKAVTM